ncbi:MAG: hypothetical protein CVU95_13090 [Firmicutes bacterium HGW-Firmicutes-2]|jgi:signal transduction histidine kinase|uniref:histidine kinase n=1 Tax=Petrocella atlantisensis TaxID=2173034 RepID=A0A3P7RX28_9FIRM|nr:HAMP domain-containing sensor histidine kinase [Petrocella atlantisensis]PKM65915.1 MAG: hypothetical protein CVU95_13090 [Firmicutes bacterium HGW-Firmicutes-2]VDN47212.1 conserved protein of unknown function [Petrocella atlantisensis]
MIKINQQLSRNFIFVTMLSIAFITIIANFSITFLFSNYIKEVRNRDDIKVIRYVEKTYEDYYGFSSQGLMSILHYTFSEVVTVRLRDMQDNIIWNSSTDNMISDMGGEKVNESRLSFQNYPMNYNGKQIGSIDIGRLKSIISSFEDQQFIFTINTVFAIAFMFSVILAKLSSSRVSKNFLEPIYQIINNTELMKEGKYKGLKDAKTNTYELQELSDSIKELSERLSYQESLRKRMTSDMAHEIRTPLSTLQSHIEAFMDKIWVPDTEKLTIVYEEIIRLTKLINELTDLSIIESDEINVNLEEINLSTLMNKIVDSFEPMILNKNITLNKNISDSIAIIGDKEHFNRIFSNIISNAYKYTNENGKISVILKQSFNKVTVIVEDTGIGIPKEDIKLVFERFYRSDLSRNRGTGGTGIGLTITKSLVEANNGKISIQSEVGKGTKVICDFPII